jgi:HK97 gp10 family phage protein
MALPPNRNTGNDPTRFTLNGAKEVEEMLKKLPLEVQGEILRKINRRGAVIAKEEMQRQAPPGSQIPEHIQIVNDEKNMTGVIVRPSKKVFYARYLEYGTEVRQTDKGADRGQIPAGKKPFIRKAIDIAVPKILKYITPQYSELVKRKIEKYTKNIQKANKGK